MLNTSLGYEYILNDSQILVKLNRTSKDLRSTI